MTQKIRALALIAALLAGLAGCATPSVQTIAAPRPQEKVQMATPAPAEGSLWAGRSSHSIFADNKARNLGDIVTINIVEAASASKNATTKTARKSGVEASWSGVLEKLTGDWVGGDQKVAFGNEFDGKGETTRTSFLNAYITAQVIHVLPNGNLVIQGARQVLVNNENQFINVQGVIRVEDILANNVVLSNVIADAKIELGGQGVVSDKQQPGWLARMLDWAWPF